MTQLRRKAFVLLYLCMCVKCLGGKKSSLYPSSTGTSRSLAMGSPDVEGDLNFAKALGAEALQDLEDIASKAKNLLDGGVARSQTTLAFLLNHNLTESQLPTKERMNKAINHYISAAVKGDHAAQIMVGNYFFGLGDCMTSINYYHKAVSFMVQTIPEMEISLPSLVPHVWDEDGQISLENIPTQEELEFWEHGAYHGEAESALKAASLLIGGPHMIQRNLPKGMHYLKQAVRGNQTLAMVFLAQLYIRGLAEGSDVEALSLLQEALKYGNDIAHSGIGRLYMEGRAGLARNLHLAQVHLKKGVESGSVDAFYQLGRLYSLDEGIGSIREAVDLWKIPASMGHVYSAWSLAEYYYSHLIKSPRTVLPPKGTTDLSTKLCENAAHFYRLVSLAGNWTNLLFDAFLDYSSGRKGAALMKYLFLSDLGYNAAHINAARILDEGGHGLYVDDTSAQEQALQMWLKTAKGGNSKGHVRIGDYLYYGLRHEGKDHVQSAEHYQKAALMGDAEGGFSLAQLMEWGEGVEQNIQKAKEVYNSLVALDRNAEVPVVLALARLQLFSAVNDIFKVDLYTWNWRAFNFVTITHSLKKIAAQLDLWLILLISLYVFVNLYLRRR